MKTFKQYITEAKLTRVEAPRVKVGDVIQGNVRSAKDVHPTWGEVVSVTPQGRDIIIKVRHVTFTNGQRTELGTTEEINALDRQVFAKRVE